MATLLTPEQDRQIARLKFPPPLEAEFWLDWAEKIRRPVQIIASAGIGLCAVFLLCTYLIVPDGASRLTNTLSVLAILPILASCFVLTRVKIWPRINPALLWALILAMTMTNGFGLAARDISGYERGMISNWMFFSVIVIGSGLALVRSAGIAMGILIATYVFFTFGVRPISEPARTANWMILMQTGFFAMAAAYVAERRARTEFLLGHLLEEERQKTADVLSNVLPAEIARRLMDRPGILAERHEDASVLFADIVAFTPLAATMPPDELVGFLDGLFSRFDGLLERHGLEKIKTIGDAYMVAGGVLDRRPDHLASIAELSLEIIDAGKECGVEMRLGIHCGPLVAGVIGKRKFLYDLWGDTVNTASRMESHGLPGRIQVTRIVADRLADAYAFEKRGTVDVKGIGPVETYFLERVSRFDPNEQLRSEVPLGTLYGSES